MLVPPSSRYLDDVSPPALLCAVEVGQGGGAALKSRLPTAFEMRSALPRGPTEQGAGVSMRIQLGTVRARRWIDLRGPRCPPARALRPARHARGASSRGLGTAYRMSRIHGQGHRDPCARGRSQSPEPPT